jgi:predicted Zn-dependent protease
MPGGFIFVTRGLLTHMMNEAQLATVIGHEIGHVTARHSVQQISRQQMASLGMGIGSILSPTIAEYADVAGVGLGLFFLKYGRDHENQADQLGFRYALAEGYDTRQMAAVFETLRRDAQLAGVGRLPEWQSSHPDPGNRIQAVEQMVAATPQNFANLKVAGDEFLRQIDGLVYGADPRLGFFRDQQFLHPDLEFKLTFPTGWETQNASDAVTAVSPNGDAMVQLRAAEGSAAQASSRFLSQDGLTPGASSSSAIHGNRAVTSEFSAQVSETESLRGVVAFIEYGGVTWGILGYSLADRFTTYRPGLVATIGSFERLTDPVALAAQPMRLEVEHAARAMSLQQFNTTMPSGISLAELAVINGLYESSQLRAGQAVKRVTGTPMR